MPTARPTAVLVVLVAALAAVGSGGGRAEADEPPPPPPPPPLNACPHGHVCLWSGPDWTGNRQILDGALLGRDRDHPGTCTVTAFDVRSVYVRLTGSTAEIFGNDSCRSDRHSPVVSASAPYAPGVPHIRTRFRMRSIDIYRNR